jgi:thiaminase/transcriptional activator TenA
MRTKELIQGDAELWRAATHHAFLDEVGGGTLASAAFAHWLSQDYHFAVALIRTEARALACSPREDLELLVGGIQAMVAELDWFESKASERAIDLDVPLHPIARAYIDYLGALADEPYSVQLTALWALERAYLEGWRTALPGAPPFREFVEHWTNDAFSTYVAALEAAANRAIGRGGDAEREAFRWVAKYEQAFWEMAYVRGNG